MSVKKSVVKVSIVGEEYTLRTDAPPEHTQAVAAYVDQAIRKILGGSNIVESHKAAILAALQITDELFKAREQSAELAASTRRLTADVRRWLPPAKRGTGAGS
jgi:cell division protein ZapA